MTSLLALLCDCDDAVGVTMLFILLCSENTSLDAGMTKSVSHPACAVVYSMVMGASVMGASVMGAGQCPSMVRSAHSSTSFSQCSTSTALFIVLGFLVLNALVLGH